MLVAAFALVALVATACGSSASTDGAQAVAEPTEVAAPPAPAPTATAISEPTPTPAPTEAPAPTAPDPTPAPTAEPELDASLFPLADEVIEWQECGTRLQCGTIDVPIDYNDPALGTLSIAVNVHRTDDLDARVGYLLINPGGPGESGLETVAGSPERATDEVLAAFDIVGFDPRGVGESEPTLACGVGDEFTDLLRSIDDQADTPEDFEIGNEAVQLCVESMGPAAIHIGTDAVVRDMDEIRKALGADQISFFGASYGSTVGGWYATLFPEHVRSMVVDGASNPALEIDNDDEADLDIDEIKAVTDVNTGPLEEFLRRALLSCADATCPIWNDGDPIGYWYDTAPKLSLVTDAAGGDQAASTLAVIGHLYDEADWPSLHESLRALREDDDPAGFMEAAGEAGFDPVAPFTITDHVNCLDRWSLFPGIDVLAEITEAVADEETEALVAELQAWSAERFPLWSAVEVEPQADPCLFFGSLNPPSLDGPLDGGGVPILVIGNENDPVTPYVQSEQYANDVLSNGRLVRVQAPQHVVYPTNACVTELVHAALIDQEYPDQEVICPPGGDAANVGND